MIRRIAFFDFDGTITTKDTFLEFIKFSKGSFSFYSGFLLYAPFMVAFKLKLISNSSAKQMILKHFFKKMPLSKFQSQCDEFALKVVPTLIRPKALKEIKKLQELGAKVVIVSASAENWLKGWCEMMKTEWIATRLVSSNDLLTGALDGNNCYGDEKVRRINEVYDLGEFDEIYCYGDTNGDKPLLALATIAFYKPFR